MNYLKIGRADELSGRDRTFYRFLEIMPAVLSWLTLIGLITLSCIKPVWVAIFLLFFDVYWLLLVLYYGIHLIASYRQFQKNLKIDWALKCKELGKRKIIFTDKDGNKGERDFIWSDICQVVIFPFYQEGYEIIKQSLDALVESGWPTEKMIVVLGVEERAGQQALERAKKAFQEFGARFKHFAITIHPENIEGERQGKGANQAWSARKLRQEYIIPQGLDERSILISVFDMDTIVNHGYFHILTHRFLTVSEPYRASYQPIPVYYNNIWQSPFFSRIAAFSNTFWQMIQQVRAEKMATYSSHSMTWSALVDIDFWSVNMVSEDSRVFFHCFCFYNGDYRIEPLHFPVSMDACLDSGFWTTARNLYKQQRRWGWGIENIPYLIFNTAKRWKNIPRWKFINEIILVQIYGFHSWATYALIIAVIGWAPMLLGGNDFNATVLSANLPGITQWLMTLAMVGLIASAVLSNILLPKRPAGYKASKNLAMVVQWVTMPLTIIIFGSIPALESQTRLMFGKYMGFWVTPKERVIEKEKKT